MTDIAARKATLEARLSELEDRLQRIESHLEETPDADWGEQAQDAENDEVLEELGNVGQTEIAAIRAALKRIDAGTYGVCVTCGETIEAGRLDLIPHTPFCAKDA